MDVLTVFINHYLQIIGLPLIPLNQFIFFLFCFNLILLFVVFFTLWFYIILRNFFKGK